MARVLLSGLLVIGLVATAAAQTQDPNSQNTGGTPGTWVRGALQRHQTIQGERLNRARFGGSTQTQQQGQSTGTNTTGTGTGSGGLADLLALAAGGGNLGSLLGNLTGLSTGTSTGTTTGTSTDTSTSGSSTGTIPPPSNGTSYTLEDLIAMGQKTGATQKDFDFLSLLDPSLWECDDSEDESASAAGEKTGNAQVMDGTSGTQGSSRQWGGAIGRLPKPEQLFQQNTGTTGTGTTQELSFKERWANAMLQTFFTALTVGLQSSTVIDAIKDGLRPLMFPGAEQAGTDGSDGSGGSGGKNTGGSGDGIEDLTPSGDSGGGGSSI